MEEKTPEQMRMELYQKVMQQQGGAGQHLCEVAMPGVVRNVNPDEAKQK